MFQFSLKTILTILLITNLCQFNFAQKANLGITLGANYSSIGGDFKNGELKIGGKFGLIFNHKISSKISFNPEIVYSQLGTNSAINKDYLDLDYVSVPLNFRFHSDTLNSNDNVFFQIGPQFSTLVNSKLSIENRYNPYWQNTSFNTLDLGLNTGIGFAAKSFSIYLNYYYGFTNVIITNNLDSFSNNTFISVSAGYFIFNN